VPLLSAFAADTTDASLRLSAVQALGLVGRAGQDAPLLAALSDKEASIRLAAALSLRKFGSRTSSAPLLDRLERAAEEDRGALGLALAGPLSVTRDAAVLARAATVLATSDGPSRDVLIDAFGAVPGENGSHPLVSLSPRADAPTRAKIAEALGAHPESIVALSTLAADADDAVRANAVWSLGIIGGVRAVPVLSRALADRDPSVRGNAAAALGYAGTNDKATAGSLCRAAEDDRAYVRANALAALALVKSRCASAVERQLLTRDSSDIVRAAAGRLLSSVPSAESSTDQAVLARCRADDPSGRVASACTPSKESVSPEVAARVSVFVVPSGATEPGARAPFALARGDGTLRLGLADRSGMVTEVAAPKGVLHLEIPTPLSE
jgi:HEAT repeat protein